MFRKRYKRAPNPRRRYYAAQVLPVIIAMLCMPLFPALIPIGQGTVSRYVLLVLPLLIFVLGLLVNRRLRFAMAADAQLREQGKEMDALNASTLLQLSTALFVFLGALSMVGMLIGGHRVQIAFSLSGEVYRRIAAIAVGLTLCFYGYFSPLIPYGHVMGLQTKYTLRDATLWSACHVRCGKVLLVGGGLLALCNEFWEGRSHVALGVTVAAAILLLLVCYFFLCKGLFKTKSTPA